MVASSSAARRIRYFGRPSLTRWVVPIDDVNTWVIAWRNVNAEDDPEARTKRDEIGWGSVDFYGQSVDRPYEQRQSNPGDWDAWVSQGPINSHAREHLGATDHGVRLLRTALRKGIRDLGQGIDPVPLAGSANAPVPTYAGDTILRIPRGDGDDRKLILETSRRLAAVYVDFAHLPVDARRSAIAEALGPLNVA